MQTHSDVAKQPINQSQIEALSSSFAPMLVEEKNRRELILSNVSSWFNSNLKRLVFDEYKTQYKNSEINTALTLLLANTQFIKSKGKRKINEDKHASPTSSYHCLKNCIMTLADAVADSGLTKAQILTLKDNVDSIPSVDQLFKQLLVTLRDNHTGWVQNPTDHINKIITDPNIYLDKNRVITELQERFIKPEKKPALDMRVQNRDARIRRMVSLSRLFSFPGKISVCSAVSYYDNTLYISANCSHESVVDELAMYIKKRIELINEHIVNVASSGRHLNAFTEEDFDDELCEATADKLYQNLVNCGDTSLEKEDFTQAILKVTKSLFSDDESFDSDLKSILLSRNINYCIILPKKIENGTASFIKIYGGASDKTDEFNLDLIDHTQYISGLHAEQMICASIFKLKAEVDIASLKPKLLIGTSLLPCLKCDKALEGVAEMPGTHNIHFPGTATLFRIPGNGLTTPTHSPNKGLTRADKSARKSPFKRKRESTASTASRSLFGALTETMIDDSESSRATKIQRIEHI